MVRVRVRVRGRVGGRDRVRVRLRVRLRVRAWAIGFEAWSSGRAASGQGPRSP